MLVYFLIAFTGVYVGRISSLNVSFNPPNPVVFVDHELEVGVVFNGILDELQEVRQGNWSTASDPTSVLGSEFSSSIQCVDPVTSCNGTIKLTGRFLGFGRVTLMLQKPKDWTAKGPPLLVTVLRQDKVINKVFTAFVAIIVTINYINMGCALDLDVVKAVLKKPVGPAIGFVCQFVVMPLVAYAVGLLIFDDPVLRLGLFTFGSSPGGGASNMWTVLLKGNLNLSITMTFVSAVAALGTIPLWLFTLGKTILKDTNIVIPFSNILISLVCLIIPIGIGILIQRRYPKMAARSKRILAPVCIILIICIIVMASIANVYMFYMLTWKMVAAASLSVWTGFLVGTVISIVFRFNRSDVVAIAIETGIQNSGIAFLLLSYSLKPPVSDMAAVVPVAASIITPVPLFVIYCFQRFWNCCRRSEDFELQAINVKSHQTNGGTDNLAHTDVNY